MSKHDLTRRCAVGLVAFTGLISGLSASAMPDPPQYLDLVGVVRDYHERTAPGGHPDFERRPDAGFGHYAGNVAKFLDHGPKPVYSGNGRKVNSQWRDSAGRPIAPHLYNAQFVTGSGAPTRTQVILKDSNGIDAYEVTWISTQFNSNNTSTWKYRVRELPGGANLSRWRLALNPSHQVQAGTTSGYSVGTELGSFYGIKWDLPASFTQGEFTIVLNGHWFGADMPTGVLTHGSSTTKQSAMFAPTSNASTTGSPFNDNPMLIQNPSWGDSAGSWGVYDNAGVQSPETFNQWFKDVPGVNISTAINIRFVRQSNGTYVFDDRFDPMYQNIGGFFPIDGQLFGNSAGSPNHNYHFTFEMHTQFTYDANGNQFFQFIGDDDVYVYIDGKLAIDLGGVHSAVEQYCDLRRMGLEHGKTYSLDFFFAERHRTESRVRMVTNLQLEPVVTPSVSAAFD